VCINYVYAIYNILWERVSDALVMAEEEGEAAGEAGCVHRGGGWKG